MKWLKFFEEFEQPENTGKDTFWEVELDGELIRITLGDVLDYLDNGVEIDPNDIKHLLIDVDRDEDRVNSADLDYPVILLSSKGEIKSILDGQHRVEKALKEDDKIKVRILDLDFAPQNFKSVFEK